MKKHHERLSVFKKIFYITLTTTLVASYFFFKHIQNEYDAIRSFSDCVDAGYPVLTSYPEQCKIPGKIFTNEKQTQETESKEITTLHPEKNMNPKNASYDIEGESFLLQNGVATTTDTKITYFGNELRIDLSGDGKEDTAFLLTVEKGGSGTFYYLVAALNTENGYTGTNGVFLGDRIAPQTTEWKNESIVVNYADRKIDQPMTTKPSIGISRYFKVVNQTLTEIQK